MPPAFDPTKHPRVEAGGPTGGQFAAGASGPAPTNAAPVQKDQAGATVKSLQARLTQLGYKLDADGKFGPKTQAAVRAFQRKNGLKVDGLVGPKTTAALRGKPKVTQKQMTYLRNTKKTGASK